MTREEARLYIIRHCNPDYPKGKTEWERAVNMAIKALEQPEQRWIPVTERLPNGFQTCIVTDELRKCSYEYDYNPDNEFTKKYGWRYNGRKIIAWMPLPEPWKEGEVDETS